MLSTQSGATGCEGWLAQARDELSELAVGIALQTLAISDLTERQDKFDVIEPLLDPSLLSATLLEQLLKENPLDETLLDWLMNIVVPGSSSLEPEQLLQIMSHLMQVDSLVDASVAVARTISVLFVYQSGIVFKILNDPEVRALHALFARRVSTCSSAMQTLFPQRKRRQLGPEVGPTSAFYSCIPQECMGQLGSFGPT